MAARKSTATVDQGWKDIPSGADSEWHDIQPLAVRGPLAPPPVPKAPLPGRLRPYGQQSAKEQLESVLQRDPDTPIDDETRAYFDSLNDPGPIGGAMKAGSGVMDIMRAGRGGNAARGASKVLHGVGEVATLAIPYAVSAAPVRTGLGFLTGYAGQQGGTAAAEALGASEDQSQLAGDVAGAVSGAVPFLATAGMRARNVPERLISRGEKAYERALLKGGGTKDVKMRAHRAVVGMPEKGDLPAVPGMLDRKIRAWSQEGLKGKIESGLAQSDEVRVAELESIPEHLMLPMRELFVGIRRAAKDQFTTQGSGTPASAEQVAALSAVDGVIARLGQHAVKNPVNGQMEIPARRAIAIRQDLDRSVGSRGGFTTNPEIKPSTMAAERMASGVLRDVTAELSPELAKANREWSVFKNADDALSATIERKRGHASESFPQTVAKMGGAAVGSHGGLGPAIATAEAAKWLQKLPGSTGWQTNAAIIQNALGKYMAGPKAAPAQSMPSMPLPRRGEQPWVPFKSAQASAQEFPALSGKSARESAQVLAGAPDVDTTPALKGFKSARESAATFAEMPPPSAAESAQVLKRAPQFSAVPTDRPAVTSVQRPVEVPSSGIPEPTARVQDMRERLAQQLTQKPWGDLDNSERLAVDDLVRYVLGHKPSR